MSEFIYDTLDAVPEEFRDEAVESEGRFSIRLVSQPKFEQFRDACEALTSSNDELKLQIAAYAKVTGDDLDHFQATLATLRKIEREVKDGQLRGTDTIEKEISTRVASMREDYESQVQAAKEETSRLGISAEENMRKYHAALVDLATTEAIMTTDTDVIPTALYDIKIRARKVFSVNPEGTLIAKDGEATIYGLSGDKPMTPAEWLKGLKYDAPYYFKGEHADASSQPKSYLPTGMTEAQFEQKSGAERLRIARAAGY